MGLTVYVCLDERDGMLFNGRRQSRDGAVLEDIRACLPEELMIDPFSEALIRAAGIPYILAEELPGEGHYFLEAGAARDAAAAEKIVIYRWNRHYPADVRWDLDLAEQGYVLEECLEFPGRSHEKITKEVYVR